MHLYSKWYHPYAFHNDFKKKVAYFSMEFAVDQALKTYSGGLGFLAGSHMRSAFDLKQNLIGVGILWKYGYYDQVRRSDQTLDTAFIEKNYNFLEDTGIEVEVQILDNPHVHVRAYVLRPEIFGTVPMYFLTTDLESNDHLSRTITDRLYDANELTRISQSIILGIGGAKVVEALGGADIYHLNEGHALPAFFYLHDKGVKKDQMVFTTHTPEKAGNEEHDGQFLNRMGFFGRKYNEQELADVCLENGMLSYTVAAMRFSKRSNAVSQLHGHVSRDMWRGFENLSPIIAITNAQNQGYWQDKEIKASWEKRSAEEYRNRKRILKQRLFEEVANQTGKLFDPDILTVVWARRFAGYKRADLLLRFPEKLDELLNHPKYPIQIIWAGKPYPRDFSAIDIFNKLVNFSKPKKNCTVLIGYEMLLSKRLKLGSDIWLNNPRITREASGTSGMTAAMNGSVNVSTNDGWIPEFAKDGENCFTLPELDHMIPVDQQDDIDAKNLYDIMLTKVMPTYYDSPEKWIEIAFKGIDDVIPQFTSSRMATEYYELMYK